jgi:hypothetical protein
MSTGLHLRRSRDEWTEKITSAPPPEHRADAQQQQQQQQQQHRSISPVSSSSAHHASQPQLPQHAYHHLVGVPVALDAVPLQRAPVPRARMHAPGHVPPLMSENPYAFLLSSEPPPPPRATPNTLAAVNYLQTLLAEPSMRAGNARYVGPVDDDYQYQQQRQAQTQEIHAPNPSGASADASSAAPPSLQSMLAPDEPASPTAAHYRAQVQAPPNSNAPAAASKRAEFWSNAIKQAASSFSTVGSSSFGGGSGSGYGGGYGESAAPHRSPPRRLDSREGREHAEKLARQREYVEALHCQMQEKQARARQQREREIEIERAKDEEIRTYNPFGRAGAGAPLRDASGRVITQLTELRSKALQNEPVSPTQWHSPPASLRSPRKTAGSSSGGGGVSVSLTSYSASEGGSSLPSAFAFTKAPPGGNYGSPTGSSSNGATWPSSSSSSSSSSASLSLSPRRATTPLTARFGGSITRLHEHQSPQEVSQRERARAQLQEDLAAQVREKQERMQMEKVLYRAVGCCIDCD